MTSAPKKKRKSDDNTFFLYVAIHSALTAIANLFKDD
jgi:hypothetical protein